MPPPRPPPSSPLRPGPVLLALGLSALLVAPARAGLEVAADVDLLVDGNLRGVLGRPNGRAARAQAERGRLLAASPPPLLLSTGAVLGPSSASFVDGGEPVVELMNAQPYRAMALGRLDLFAGVERALEVLAPAEFPVVATNLFVRDPEDPLAATWRQVVTTSARLEHEGAEVLVLGVIEPRDQGEEKLDPRLEIRPVSETLAALAGSVESGQVVVLLGDLEFRHCLELLRRFPWIDLVFLNQRIGQSELLSGSFEHGLPDGRKLVWVPYFGTRLARVEVRSGPRPRAFAEAIDLEDEGPRDLEVLAMIRQRRRQRSPQGDVILCRLSEDELRDFRGAVADALRVQLRAEVGVIRRGTGRMSEVRPVLTRRSLRAIYPFDDHTRLLSLTGRQLRRLWESRDASADEWRHLVLRGLEERGGTLLVNGRTVDNQQHYRVASVGRMVARDVGVFPPDVPVRRRVSVYRALTDYFARPRDERAMRVRGAASRPVRRHETTLDFSRRSVSFGGSAPEFQTQVPGRANLNSTIPGLVGREFQTASTVFRHTTTVDHRGHDFRLDLDARYSTFNSTTTNEFLDGELRWARKDPLSHHPQLFGALSFNTILGDQDQPNLDTPFFAKAVGGWIWRPRQKTKVLAGLGYIRRFSLPGEPGNAGFNLGFEWERETLRGLTLKTALDGFASFDSEQIRTADFRWELRLKIGGPLGVVLRQTSFLWKDATVDSSALRNESFIGLGVDWKLRAY